MEITDANENAIVNLIEKTVEQDGIKKGDTLPPLPSLENLSISTESTEAASSYSRQDEELCSSEFNDCSSSVSSQDSNNFVATGYPKKRSVFSQYWQKTGQKPVLLRPIKPQSAADLDIRKSPSQVGDATLIAKPPSNSALLYPLDTSIASLSNADLLEDHDCESDCQNSSTPKLPLEQHASAEPANPPLVRRRSILPPAPIANPALRSWKKSASLSNVEAYSGNSKLAHKTHSLPRMRSSSMILQPCLRPYQKYSPSKQTSSTSLSEATSSEASPASSRVLKRSDSSCSSVSFQETVDVRHFEPPQLTYAGKGWSDYFN